MKLLITEEEKIRVDNIYKKLSQYINKYIEVEQKKEHNFNGM
jgi:hypothetical protein